MEWLKDKKNLPIVAGLGILVLIVALVAVLFETGVIGGSGGSTTTASNLTAPMPESTTARTNMPMPESGTAGSPQGSAPGSMGRPMMPNSGQPMGAPGAFPSASGQPGMPGGPGMPGAPGVPGAAAATTTPAATGTVKIASAPVNFKTGPDPFYVADPTATTKVHRYVRPVRTYAPPVYIASVNTGTSRNTPATLSNLNIALTPQESPTERVSGVVLTGNGVHAVLEANGQSQDCAAGRQCPRRQSRFNPIRWIGSPFG